MAWIGSVGPVARMSSADQDGFGFSLRNSKGAPLVDFLYSEQLQAEQARDEMEGLLKDALAVTVPGR